MRISLGKEVLRLMVVGLYVFLYAPIAYIIYVAFQQDSVWPFPPSFTLQHFESLIELDIYHAGLVNSLIIGAGTGVLATLLATAAVIGVLRYRVPGRAIAAVFFLSPLFIAHVPIGIATLMFNRSILGLRVSIDGGMARNPYFCQFLADALGRRITVPATAEITALGCAMLAGRSSLECTPAEGRSYDPAGPQRHSWSERFADAVARSRSWRGPVR